MGFKRALQQHATQSPRDWYSAEGTGWGPQHDQPNPIARAFRRLRQDVSETRDDFRDELSEVPYRLKKRLDAYIKGENR